MTKTARAIDVPNRFLEVNGRTLAYRIIGTGRPMLMCTRFRGNIDQWDPAFLDALAAKGLQAITFDYTGLGLSTGEPSYDPVRLATDAVDLAHGLDLHDAILCDWSIGGIAAQIALTILTDRVTHCVLIGTTPPGPLVKLPEQLFFDTATKPVNTFEDLVILFFEPMSTRGRDAARRSIERISARTEGRSPEVPAKFAADNLGPGPRSPMFPAEAVLEFLRNTQIPILHVGGDHDIIFPVENWYALNGTLPTLQLLTFPRAGHGPQHEHPEATAEHIGSFVRYT